MVGIVQANGNELANTAYRAAHARRATHQGQLGWVELGQLGQRRLAELGRPDIGQHGAEVAQLAVGINKTRFFFAGIAITNQFHGLPFT